MSEFGKLGTLKKMRKSWLLLILCIALIGLASELSGFQLSTPDQRVNWEIVLMLTPYGLITNLLFGANPDLHPYYFVLSNRSGFFDNLPLIIELLFLWLAVFTGLWQFGKSR